MKIKNKKFSGMTLIEVIVAISIFTICMAGFSYLFLKSWKANSYIIEAGQASVMATQGMGRVVRYIREARQADNGDYLVDLADNNDFTFYSDYDNDNITERLHIYKNENSLLIGIAEPSGGSYPSEDQETKIVTKDLVNEENVPVFYYYNNDYIGSASEEPLQTPAVVSNVKMVKILLKVDTNINRDPVATELSSLAELRNAN